MDLIQPSKSQMPYRKWYRRKCKVLQEVVPLLPFKEMHPYSSGPNWHPLPFRLNLSPVSPGTAPIKPVYSVSFLISCGTHCPHSWCTSAFWPFYVFFSNHLICASLDSPVRLYIPSDQYSMMHCSFISSRASTEGWHIFNSQETCF